MYFKFVLLDSTKGIWRNIEVRVNSHLVFLAIDKYIIWRKLLTLWMRNGHRLILELELIWSFCNSICIEILMEGVFVCYFAKHAVFKMGSIW